jgi:hypothetical protein
MSGAPALGSFYTRPGCLNNAEYGSVFLVVIPLCVPQHLIILGCTFLSDIHCKNFASRQISSANKILWFDFVCLTLGCCKVIIVYTAPMA